MKRDYLRVERCGGGGCGGDGSCGGGATAITAGGTAGWGPGRPFVRPSVRPSVRLQLVAGPDRLAAPDVLAGSDVARLTGPVAYSKEAVSARLTAAEQPLGADTADQDLVRLCQGGDQAAFTEIVKRYKDRVHWLVRRMVGSPDDEDLTQEVFIRAYQALPGLRSGATLRTWLFRIAHNLCLSELKKRGTRGVHLSIEDQGEQSVHRLLPEDGGRLEEDYEKRDFEESVRALVGRLPAPYRAVLTLHYLNEVKYEDVADIMGIPVGTVKTHIYRAKLRLRDLVLAEMDHSCLPEGGDR